MAGAESVIVSPTGHVRQTLEPDPDHSGGGSAT